MKLVHPLEKVYFAVCLIASVFVYNWLYNSFINATFESMTLQIVFYTYAAVILLYIFIAHGILVGRVRGNGIRVTENQFPGLLQRARDLSAKMGLKKLPAIYILQEGGMLNAFATRLFYRNYVVLYSDVMEMAYEKGDDAVAFILAHELAHLKRRHTTKRWLVLGGLAVPFLGQAYFRACEYTSDRFAAYYAPNGAVDGLALLAAGKRLYRELDVDEYIKQIQSERGFWVWFAEKVSTHPHLTKRLLAVKKQQMEMPVQAFTSQGMGVGI